MKSILFQLKRKKGGNLKHVSSDLERLAATVASCCQLCSLKYNKIKLAHAAETSAVFLKHSLVLFQSCTKALIG